MRWVPVSLSEEHSQVELMDLPSCIKLPSRLHLTAEAQQAPNLVLQIAPLLPQVPNLLQEYAHFVGHESSELV
jgi:hypothetical protein